MSPRRRMALTVQALFLALTVASCGESPWEANSQRTDHVAILDFVSNEEVFVEEYNDTFDRAEVVDDCAGAKEQFDFYGYFLQVNMAEVAAGKTERQVTPDAVISIRRQVDLGLGKTLAYQEWMRQNYCP